jgi:hypothetical protein
MALGLKNFMENLVPWTYFGSILQILKLGMIGYNNKLQIIDQYLTVLALGLRIFMAISVFRTFLINFADIEMKLGMIVYDIELQIEFDFLCYLSIFDRVTSTMSW